MISSLLADKENGPPPLASPAIAAGRAVGVLKSKVVLPSTPLGQHAVNGVSTPIHGGVSRQPLRSTSGSTNVNVTLSSTTSLSHKRPLQTMFGVKKLGLGKALRVVPGVAAEAAEEEEETTMTQHGNNNNNTNPITHTSNQHNNNNNNNNNSNVAATHQQHTNTHNVIVTTPAAAKRSKASPPTPIQYGDASAAPAPMTLATPIPAPPLSSISGVDLIAPIPLQPLSMAALAPALDDPPSLLDASGTSPLSESIATPAASNTPPLSSNIATHQQHIPPVLERPMPPATPTPAPAPSTIQATLPSSTPQLLTTASRPTQPATPVQNRVLKTHSLLGPKLMSSKPISMNSTAPKLALHSSTPHQPAAHLQHHTSHSPPNATPQAHQPTPATIAAPIPTHAPPTAAASSASSSAPAPVSSPPASNPVIISDVPVRQPGDSRFVLNNQVYTKLATIGRGGSSLVYKVIGTKGNIFALKEINLQTDESHKAPQSHVPDYITEVSTLHVMANDPYVIQMYLAQEDKTNKFFYMLMECGSCDLDKHLHTIRSNLSMTPDSYLLSHLTVKYFWQAMLHCVSAIHARGIIHTDLKPVNFVFTEQGTLKLIDFGISKTIAEESTSVCFAKPCGTLNFMSPESLPEDGGLIRASSDVWSLGCILYSWIYGEPPFGRITNHVKKWLAIQDEKELIHFHREIHIIEQVAPPPSDGSVTKTVKGSGISVSLKESGCTITRTYPTMPSHLIGRTLPIHSKRYVEPAVIDVLKQCLQRQPALRPSAAQLLQHPYITQTNTTNNDGDTNQVKQLQTEIARLTAQLAAAQQNNAGATNV